MYESITLIILACVANAGIDRIRGAGGTYGLKCDVYAALMFAFVCAMLFGFNVWVTILMAAAYKLGESTGWGEPFGKYLWDEPMRPDHLEWWQKGILKTNRELALLVRGFIWGAPVSAVLAYEGLYTEAYIMLGSFTLGFLVSCMIARKIGNSTNYWGLAEEIRGALLFMPLLLTI